MGSGGGTFREEEGEEGRGDVKRLIGEERGQVGVPRGGRLLGA